MRRHLDDDCWIWAPSEIRGLRGGLGLSLAGGPAGRQRSGPTYIIVPPDGQQLDAAQSTVGVSGASVVSGSTRTITVTTKNAAGSVIVVAGLTVVVSKTGGTATGTLSGVTDNLNGTYTCTYTGVLAGTAQTISATLNGISATGGTVPTIAVTPGAIDRTTSTLALSVGSVQAGNTLVATVTGRDAAGNLVTVGGATVAMSSTGGTGTVSHGAVTDNSNGTYSQTITALTSGTAKTMTATIGGQSITTSMPTVTVTAAQEWTSGPGVGDTLVYDDNFAAITGLFSDSGSYTSQALRTARRQALEAGGSPFFMFADPNPGDQTDAGVTSSIETAGGGLNGSPRYYRITLPSTSGEKSYRCRMFCAGPDNTNLFGPSTATIVATFWLRYNISLASLFSIKGIEFRTSGDRVQAGFYSSGNGMWCNLHHDSDNREAYGHLNNGGPGAPTLYTSWNDITGQGWLRHTLIYKRNTTRLVTSDGVSRYFVEDTKLIDMSQAGLDTGWMVTRSALGATDGNMGDKYYSDNSNGFGGGPVTGAHSLLSMSGSTVRGIWFPEIMNTFSAAGGTIDIGRVQIWYRP